MRETPLLETYRESEPFIDLRHLERFSGKCGRCEFNTMCGGSRSRTFAL